MSGISRALVIILFSAVIAVSQTKTTDNGWPRKFAIGGNSVSVYQPQLEEWSGNSLSARAAIAITDNQSKQPLYGVLWFTARAEIDKINRLVTLSDFRVKKINIPMAPDKAAAFESAFQARTAKQDEVIALDRLLADMAINHAATNSTSYEVKNDPPQVFFSTRPSILVLIDGTPVLRPVKDTGVERVINTRVLMLRDQTSARFYLHLMDGWMESSNLNGPWTIAGQTSPDLRRALEAATVSKQVDLLDGSKNGARTSLAEAIRQNALPAVLVSTQPAELLQTQGEPHVARIEGTDLIYVINTDNDIFVHTPSQDHFILLSGRWFKSQSMMGPWQYVAAEKLPADFAKIPATHQKAAVLVSVPGTPQAKEALIANAIPQTATITRSAATLTVSYDGSPQFKSIENTALRYAANTATPVIRVESSGYYAVQNGVWFFATSPAGPWTVATSVPVVIYTIPVSSPLHYVTYVKIYGSTPEVVYVGYTPGYYGTIVSSSSVVVYGTGWYYPPYVGAYWYGAPYTYGYGAAFTWGVATGWGLAYGYGYGWWGAATYATAYYGPYGWGGVAATNVYGQWGNVAYSGTRAAWANPYTGNVGYGGAYTGVNSVTGTRYAARGGTNTNVYTGTTVTGGAAAAYNPNTGRISAGQAGTANNVYTGNSAAGTRGTTYNPQTGVISGGAVGGVKNGSTGQVTAGGGGFAYNTRTDTGVAVGNNNVYASKDGSVYRYNQSSGVQQKTSSGWESVQRSADRSWVQNQQNARGLGEMRTRDFSSMRGNPGGLRNGGGGLRRR
ncbi:MAG TPA: hypothetical protein VGQ41_08090 [Pyrinomonadaceae bacterium]|jgi:hypothetical protein|nr:hypothetical protein [Pyrinomonadaceae bacterium]